MLNYLFNEYPDPSGFQKGFLGAVQPSGRVSKAFLKLYAFLQSFGGMRSWVHPREHGVEGALPPPKPPTTPECLDSPIWRDQSDLCSQGPSVTTCSYWDFPLSFDLLAWYSQKMLL